MKKLICLLLLMPLLFSGCSKENPVPKPTAEFTYTIGSNGTVTFNNVSTNADSYKWVFGDSSTSTEKSPNYQYSANKTFQVSLTATGLGGSDVIVKSVNINNITGSLVVYKSKSTGSSPIEVYIDDVFRGTINGQYYYSSPPSCGNSTSVTTVGLTEGKHSVMASERFGAIWMGTATIVAGKCGSIGLN